MNVKLEPSREVKIEVVYSKCDLVKKGDTIFIKGPIVITTKSSTFCATALMGIYPWIFTARFGIESKDLEWDNGYKVWCPEKLVEFSITF